MPFATFSRNPLVSNRFTHFFHQPHYALSFYAPYKHYQTEINDKKGKRQKYIQNIRYFCTLKYNLIKLNVNAEHYVR